jgi:hypothetical protein
MESGRRDVGGLERIESEQVINAQETRNALSKQFVRLAKLEDTSPSVMNVERLQFRNVTPTLVVNFDDGQEGQRVEILGDGNTTIQNNAKIITASGTDTLLDADVTYAFTRYTDGKWHQSAGVGGGGGGGGGGSGVTTFAGRSGAVIPVAGDYPPTFIGAVPVSHLTAPDPHPQYAFDSDKGIAGGYAGLDGTGKVPLAQLPAISLPAWVTNHPDTPPASPVLFAGVAYDKEFSVLGAHGGTVVGSPTNAPVIVDGALKIFSGTSGSPDIKGVEWPCPAGAFTVTGKFRRRLSGNTYGAFGPVLRVGSSGDTAFTAFWSALFGAYTSLNIEIDDYNTQTNRGAAGFGGNMYELLMHGYYMKMYYDGTNLTYSVSFTGHPDSFVVWAVRGSGAYGRVGFFIDNFGGTQNVGYCEWLRFT